MPKQEYSALSDEAIGLYRMGRIILYVWVLFCIGYVIYIYFASPSALLMNNIPEPNSGEIIDLVGTIVLLVGLNGIVVFSAMFPVFFMLFCAIVFLRASKVISSPCARSIVIFWSIQCLNLYFVRYQKSVFFSDDPFTIGSPVQSLCILMGLVVVTILYRLLGWMRFHSKLKEQKDYKNHHDNSDREERMFNQVLYYISAILISILIAILFDLNLVTRNLTFSNGIVFGVPVCLLLLRPSDLQKLLLYLIVPDTYGIVHAELEAHHKAEVEEAKRKVRSNA
jgi:hypothetical protein